MGEMKPTLGPWEAIEKQDADPSEGTHWLRCPIGALGYWRGHKRAHEDCNWILNGPDARLIAEAGTVFHNTGLSPVQLVEMVKELRTALSGLDDYVCNNIASDYPTGVDVNAKAFTAARAALAKCEGVK